MNGPNPDCKYPFEGLNYDLKTTKRVVFLKNIITNKNIIVGDYTYYDDPNEAENFEIRNVPVIPA
jgi:virginiamycin A acetyltransferase